MTTAFQNIQKRIEAAKFINKSSFNYCYKVGSSIIRTHCKLCGRVLSEGNRLYPERRVVKIEFDNHSYHETPMCVTCALQLQTNTQLHELEFIYAADLNSYLNGNSMPEDDRYWESLAWRIPVKVAEVRIE